jgi:hypothetical protein
MECVITVFKRLNRERVIPIAEIQWVGDLPARPHEFARKRGGDYIEIQTLEEYLETGDTSNLI